MERDEEDAGTRYRLDPERVVWREVEGEIIALDLRRSLYLGINRSGAVLWPLLVEGGTHPELIERLAEGEGIDADLARAEVDGFIESLGEHGLLAG